MKAMMGVSGTICDISYVDKYGIKLPMLKPDGKPHIDQEVCPICGGRLTQMGWFRHGPLHEMLNKCEVCGLAVFR